ncbi:hypothetical protein, variant 3 [Aphanomyces invadans]|uniref:Delta-aminolevulinic acid dehydratase n=1 Tax=Aphanomyces invadans TaxID=157072 RepID=A0A024TK79_9STRA|nr:hypothetical protein, variant 2 [Aphanomyces invadans]XP_008876880.1 hypothetical protein, variant 3 [Aphanomyces invadans]ETV94565.1 hypothetical protein, variant 2 [Aphanomyces invadans]ETV94566.1 hypothetical protein, variant 3 [Aphanomyces invadans]|eukprot:XP_008876878.1 hypothetical protein, variant 2 [Aphanomyces invadans]
MRAWTEPTLHGSQLIYPLFITARPDDNPIRGLEPNVQWGNRNNYATLVAHLDGLVAKGLRSVMLFGVVDNKDAEGCMADDPSTPVMEVMKVLRTELPSLLVACDVCMCEYTDHGHCGLLRTSLDGEEIIDNAATVARLGDIALAYAKAGAHMVCPSDMMDNRIGVIRSTLNQHGFAHVSIMAYTSKKASCMYAPFRDAVESTFKGDRKRYQHPVGSVSHALLAYDRDVAEGADTVIVKPSLFYADIVRTLSDKKLVPVACYVVSGEYKMLKDYGDSTGSMDAVVREAHLSLVRAGGSILITYFTPFILERLLDGASKSSALPMDSMCREFTETGTCKYGYRCKMLHVIDGILNGDVRVHPSATQQKRPPSPEHSARVPAHASRPLHSTDSNQTHSPPLKSSQPTVRAKSHSSDLKQHQHSHKHNRSSKQRLRSKSTCDNNRCHNVGHHRHNASSSNNQDDNPPAADELIPPVPPPNNLPFNDSTMHRWLSHEIETCVDRVDVTMHLLRDKQRRATAALNRLVQDLYPASQVEVYGSTYTQLCLPHSDVDCVIVLPTTDGIPCPIDMLETVMTALGACPWAGHLELVRSARIPILKLQFVKGKLPVKMDITCSHSPGHSGIEARTLVDEYRLAMPALRPLVLVLKAHLHAQGLNASYSGGLSSYALVVLVVRFLQFQGDVHSAFMEELEPQYDGVYDMQPCMIYTFFRNGRLSRRDDMS